MLNEELKYALRHHLQNNPTDATEVLAIVTEAMQHYEHALQAKRSAEAWNALHILVGQLARPPKKGENPALLLDAAYLLFPRGLNADSTILWSFGARFVAACKAQPLTVAWIEMTRGKDCAAWYSTHVAPKL